MDAEILSDRLSATEDAVIKIDEKLDELVEEIDDTVQAIENEVVGETDNVGFETALLVTNERITALEGTITECLTRQTNLEARLSSTEAMAVEALTSEQEVLEPEPEIAVEEILPENEEVAPREASPRWWEHLLVPR